MDATVTDTTDWRGRIQVRADWLAAKPAYQLAEEIHLFWKKRGAEIAVEVQEVYANPSAAGHQRPIYIIRSNLVNGLPRGWTARKLMGAGDV